MSQVAARRRYELDQDWALFAGVAALTATLALGGFVIGAMFVVAVAGGAICFGAVAQPRWGVYIAVAVSFAVPGLSVDPQLHDVLAYAERPVPGISLTPLEIIVLSSLLGVIRMRVFQDGYRIRCGDLAAPVILFCATIGAAYAYGVSHGGDRNIALWETRGLFLVLPVYYIVSNAFRSRGEVEALGRVAIAAILTMSAYVLYQHVTNVRGTAGGEGSLDVVYPHESALFAAGLSIYFIIRAFWGSPWRALLCALMAIIPLAALFVMRRRAGMVALDVGLMMLMLALARDNVRKSLIVVPLAIAATAALLVLTWHQPGSMGQAAQGFRVLTQQQSQDTQDLSSDDYRARETANVRANILARPLVGLGFGRPYDFPQQLPDLSRFWPFFRYIPHNSVLWIWMEGGLLAFTSLLVLFATAAARATQLFRALRMSELRAAPLMAGVGVLMFAVFAYTDIGLANSGALIFFGVALGLIGAVSEIARREPSPVPATSVGAR